MSRSLAGGAVVAALLGLVAVDARGAKPVRCAGRYGLHQSLVTGAEGLEIVGVDGRQVTTTSCGGVRGKVKARRNKTRVKAVYRNCPGVTGKARLTATIAAPACDTMVGTFRARRAGIATQFTASLGGTLGGRLLVSDSARADVDTADPAMDGDNDTAASAQPLPATASVGGAAGPDDGVIDNGNWRFSDFYAIELDGTPRTVTLNLANPEVTDLDLFLLDPEGNRLAESTGTDVNVERIETTTESGTAYIVVATYVPQSSGTSAYVLALGHPDDQGAAAPAPDFVPGEMIVRLRAAVPLVATGRLALVADEATLVRGEPREQGGALFRLALPTLAGARATADGDDADARAATLAAVAAMRKRPDVVWAQPNYLRHAMREPNDEFFGLQWHYPLIELPEAWNATVGSPDVVVAVIDTGMLLNHPDVDQGRLVPGFDFISDPSRARDGDGLDPDASDPGDGGAGGTSSFHGTHVAGTIGAATNNGEGVAGVDWNARIMPLRVLGVRGGSDFDIGQAIRFAAGLSNDSGTVPAQRADIMNLSLGGPGDSPAMREAIQAARAAGVLVVAAAGNDNQNAGGFSPGGFPEAVCVSAVDQERQKAPYSNFGSVVDVAAPGGDTSVDRDGDGFADGVLSTLGDDSRGGGIRPIYKFYQGTSMAAPHVAGVAALMQAAFMETNGGARMTPDVFTALLTSGQLTDVIGPDNFSGNGLINARKAVAAAGLNPGGGPPTLLAVPDAVSFGFATGEATLLLRNGGSGTLTVTGATPGPDAPWLTIVPTALPAPAPTTIRLTVNRGGLAPGAYTGSLTIASDAGDLDVRVALEVGGGTSIGDVGHVFVLLIDPESGETVAQAESNAAAGYPLDLGGRAPGGTFLLVAGTDRDDDGLVGDPGEALGVHPTLDSPTPIEVPFGGQLSIDLPVLEQVAIVATNAGGFARAAPAYRRLR